MSPVTAKDARPPLGPIELEVITGTIRTRRTRD